MFCLVIFSSCKTQEDVRREREVETLNEEIQQTKKTAVSSNSRFSSIEEQISQLTGKIEEAYHQRAQEQKELQNLQEKITRLEEAHAKQVEYLKALTEKVNNQSGYIEEVIETLAKLSDKSGEKSSTKKKVDEVNDNDKNSSDKSSTPPAITLQNGIKEYKAGSFESAEDIFKQIINNEKAKKKSKEGALYHLGLIEFKNRNFNDAKAYFSKFFSEYPDSTYAPSALLHLAKTFNSLKMKEEAKMTLEELNSRFPKSKETSEGQNIKIR